MPLSGSSSVDTLSSTGSVDSHVAAEPPGAVNPLRPPKSPRRPSNSLRPASTSSVHQIDLAHPARAFYGLPSPPLTSSEASGSVGGSLRLPGSVLQAAPSPSTAAQPTTVDGRHREQATASPNGASRRAAEEDGGRSKRLSDLRERSAKIINSLSSRQTPSPTKPLYEPPMARFGQAIGSTTISSPKIRSALSSRQSLSSEETETERGGARSESSKASSSFSHSGDDERLRTNGAKKGKRVSIDSTASGGIGWPQPPPVSSSIRGHSRTASLPHSASSSDGGFSRSSGDGSSSSHAHRQHRPTLSNDFGRLASPGQPATPTSRGLRSTPSPSSSTTLSRSQSTVSVSSRGSESFEAVTGRTPLRAAATRVRPSPRSRRSDEGISRGPTPTATAPHPSSSYDQTSQASGGMPSSPSMTSLASVRLRRENSSPSSGSQSRSSTGIRSRLGSSPLVDTQRPSQKRQTSANSVEEVDALLGQNSQLVASQSDDEPRERERTASSGKRRAPLPSEFLTDSGSSTPLLIRDEFQKGLRGIPLSSSLASLSSYSEQPPSARPRYPSLPRHLPSPSPSADATSSSGSSLRINQPSESSREEQPRYARRGGSVESALARQPPSGSQRSERPNGIAFPSASSKDDDLFAGGGSEAAVSRANRTRSLLQRIEQENQESERRTRQLREVHAIKRAESSMSLSRSPTGGDFQPATPIQRRDHTGIGLSRSGACTGLPARPSTSLAYTTDVPRTAPPLGVGQHGLRSHRSVWNLQTPSSSGSHANHREGSPSPSLVRRRRLSGDPSRLGSESGRRTPMDLRSTTSHGVSGTMSVQSGLSQYAAANADDSQPDHVRNMLAASEALDRHYSRLINLSSAPDVVRTADALVSAVEQTHIALSEANRFVREQLVAAQVDERGEPADFDRWQAMSTVLRNAVRMNDEEVRASAALLIATLKSSREQLAATDVISTAGSIAGMRRSETADWTSLRHARETSEPTSLRIDPHARPSTSMGCSSIASPSARLRDAALTRERLASIPSTRTLNLIDVDSSPSDARQASPHTEGELSPPSVRRSGVLGHVFDRFAPRWSSEEPAERTWRQAKTSTASTVRAAAPSLFPSAPMVSPAMTDLSTVTATHGSPDQHAADLSVDDASVENSTAPTSYFSRAKTLSLASSSSSLMTRNASVGSDSTLGRRVGGSHHSLASAAEDDVQQRRHSGPATTSPISSIRRLSLFGGPREH